MVSYEDIKAIYENPDLLLEASRTQETKNLAADISARTRVIRLVDGDIHIKGNSHASRLYIPGESYLVKYKEVEKTVKSRRKVFSRKLFRREKNIFPQIVDYIVKGKNPKILYRNAEFNDTNSLELWLNSKGLKEINNFAQIYKSLSAQGKPDPEGVVILRNVDPITSLKTGYELDGVFQASKEIGEINGHLEITAEEAEMSFQSDNHARITDNNNNIGKFKEGILTLLNPYITIIDKPQKQKYQKLNNILTSATIGTCAALFPGVFFARYGISRGIGIIIAGGFIGGIVGTIRSYKEKISQQESNLIRIAYYGTVKDKRFENLEEILS